MSYIKTKHFKYLLGLLFYFKVLVKDLIGLFDPRVTTIKLLHLDIEPTNICNANCVFCAYQYQSGPTYKTVNFDFVKKLLDAFCEAGGGDIGLTPIVGDPLVNKDLETIVSICRKYNKIKNIGITTNGILLTKERFIALRDAGLTNINISMTFPEKSEYEKIYRNNSFDKLIKNIEDLLEVDCKGVEICLAIRTPRLFLGTNSLLKKVKSAGWKITRNIFFDDWSGQVANGLIENDLLKRPKRSKHIPCSILQSGPHALVSGKITACGCRDLEGKSELSDENIFKPFYDSGNLQAVYYENMEVLRRRFLNNNPPEICRNCHHYTPDFRFANMKDRIIQITFDIREALQFILNIKS